MKRLFQYFLISGFILLFSFDIYSQGWNSQLFNIIEFPHSVRNLGLGMNGVVSSSSIDALTYNPANLLFTKQTTFSFYHQGLQLIFNGMPINDYSIYFNIGKEGSFGIDYNDWNLGEFVVGTPDNPEIVKSEKNYERSISIGYARSINDHLGIGASLRYCFASITGTEFNASLFSIGAFDKFSFLSRKWHAGFSIMNLGSAIEYHVPNQPVSIVPSQTALYGSSPAFLSVGLSTNAIKTNFITLPVSISIAKPFDKIDDNGNGQSSFKTLFTDWGDFPNDAALSPGIAFEWNTINLGRGIYLSQNIYVGNYSDGIKSGLTNFYTHGVEISLSSDYIKLTAGYSGVWHNPMASNYFQWQFPYETFQFSIGINPEAFRNSSNEISPSGLSEKSVMPENIILTAGIGQLLRVGNAKSISIQGYDIEQKNNVEYTIESAFYLNERSALVMSFSYNSLPFAANYLQYNIISMKIETLTLSSAFRYHPFENLKNFFVQGGLGIARLNPVISTSPRYYYTTELNAAIGYNIELQNNIVLVPVVNYDLLLLDAWENHENISGNNQFNLGLRLGYKF